MLSRTFVWMKFVVSICLLFSCSIGTAQTLGGDAVFNFLRLSPTPELSALGGVNVSQPSNNIGLAFSNPALLRTSMHSQMNAVFNQFYDGIDVYHLSVGYHHPRLNTNFAWGVHYFNYGSATETDASGNQLGKFRPVDWVMQLSASRRYEERWEYGVSAKFISSNYGQYRSNGWALDVGVLYRDSTNGISASVLAKNMGTQLKVYAGSSRDELPFDLQAGITKRFGDAPFSLSLTAQRMHHFDIGYNDTIFTNGNGYAKRGSGTIGKVLDHLVAGATVFVGSYVQVEAGYNFLRRRELSIGASGNGATGFSFGMGVLLGKWQFHFARAYYQSNTAYNQFGINLQLNQFFGLGKWGEKMGW